jgi:hypothetical protein
MSKHHTTEACGQHVFKAPHILDLGTRCKSVASFTMWLLYLQGKHLLYLMDRVWEGPRGCLNVC